MKADNALKFNMDAYELLNFEYTKFHNNRIVISIRNLKIGLNGHVYQGNKMSCESI